MQDYIITIDFTFNFQVELTDGVFPQRREAQVSWSRCHAVLRLLKKERGILTEWGNFLIVNA